MEFEKLRDIIVEVLRCSPEEITAETTFVDDLGADSLDIFQIIMGIEDAFDIEIDNDEAEKIATVGDAVEQIKNAINQAEDKKARIGLFCDIGNFVPYITKTLRGNEGEV